MGYMPNGLLIKKIHDSLKKRANNTLRSKDLTLMQMSVLMALQETPNKQLSMKEMERHFQVAQSTVAGIVARLEQKGFVEAFGDVDDKRIKLVHMPAGGEICCDETAHYRKEAEELIVKDLSAEEQNQLNLLLLKVADNVK